MKAFIAFLAFVAAATAEADPVLLYNNLGTPYYAGIAPFTTLYNGVALKSAPCVNYKNEPQACASGYAHYAYAPAAAYISAARLWKREAEAEAEPTIFYNALGVPAYAGAYSPALLTTYGLKSSACVNVANAPVPCAAGLPYYAALPAVATAPVLKTVVSSPAVVSIAKREAEAEAEPVLLYNNIGTPYYAGVAPFTTLYNGVALKSAPCVNYKNQPQACAAGYAHYAYAPAAAYINAARLWKREAEAEAEPTIFYNALGAPAWAGAYSPALLTTYGLKSSACVNVANAPVPCAAGLTYYAALPAVAATPAVAVSAPITTKTVVTKSVVSSPILKSVVTSPVVGASPAVVSIAKREADSEADPAYFYSNLGLPYAGVYGAGLYGAGVYGAYASPYAAGLIHTSRLGVCLNYLNQQVDC